VPLRLLHPDHRCASTGAGHTCEWSAKIWLNTRELLKRKNMELQDCACVLYNDNSGEILLHLFFGTEGGQEADDLVGRGKIEVLVIAGEEMIV
jgi:hypothetical protein